MLLDRNAISSVKKLLRPEDFYLGQHSLIYATIIEMCERSEPVGLISATDRLRDREQLDHAGGAAYLTGLLNAAVAPANIEYHARIVLEKSLLRQEIQARELAVHRLQKGEDREKVKADERVTLEELAVRRARTKVPCVEGEVDLASLLTKVETFLKRFVVFATPHQPLAVAFWVAFTYVVDAFTVAPYLAVTSAEKRSAKTRLLELVGLLVAQSWHVIRPSEAVLFRKLAGGPCTLLLDEGDAIFRDKIGTYEGLQAVLNGGHRRGVKVPRMVGDGKAMRVEDFDVFGPKAIAAIGNLPDTVADRSIPIRLVRRARHERVERFVHREVAEQTIALSNGLATWAIDALSFLEKAKPQVPTSLNDRAAEFWEPLLAIADIAGGDWPSRAREAAVALHSERFDEETVGVSLLHAIREIFAERDSDRISTADLLRELVDRDDGPWPEFWGRQVAAGDTKGPAHRLARLLRPFGIRPQKLRIATDTLQGFYRADFEDAFARYLPSAGDGNGTSEQPAPDAGEMRSEEVLPKTTSERVSAAPDAACSDVPFSQGAGGGEDFDRFLTRAAELFDGEIVYDGPPQTGPWGMPLADGRRLAFMRMGHARAWVAVPEIGVGEGMQVWRQFALAHTEEEISQALLALERLDALGGPGDA
jgi:hypothetical protein